MAKAKREIVEVISEYVELVAKGTSQHPRWDGLCPFHPDTNPSFSVYENSQRYRCWACGAQGDVIDFLMRKLDLTFPHARDLAMVEADTVDYLVRNLQYPNRPPALDPTRDIGTMRLLFRDSDFDTFTECLGSYWHYFHTGHLDLARHALEPLQHP